MNIKIINTELNTRDEILSKIAEEAKSNGFVSDSQKVFEALIAREDQGSTGFADQIAIPHARNEFITESIILIARNNKEVNWNSLDGKETTTAISVLVSGEEGANDAHLKLLAKIAKNLIHEESKVFFKTGTITEIKNLISE